MSGTPTPGDVFGNLVRGKDPEPVLQNTPNPLVPPPAAIVSPPAAPAPKEPPAADFTPVTFNSQAEFDAAFQDRVAQAKRPYADYEERVKESEAFRKAEHEKLDVVEREKAARLAAEAERDQIKQERDQEKLVKKIASLPEFAGIPEELLTGNTEEELKTSAQRLKAYADGLGGVRSPTPNPNQGNNGGDTQVKTDPLRNMILNKRMA